MNPNFQPGMHPDADQLSVFVEGGTTVREHERMLAHLAECAECRRAVFLMQPQEATQRAKATPAKGWIWRRLLPVALPAAALACGVIAVLVYIRPHGGTPENLQQNASVRQPKSQLPEMMVAPTINSDAVARSGRPKKSFAPNAAAPNLSGQKRHAAGSLNLPEVKSHPRGANTASPQTTAATASVSQSIRPRIQSELPLNGRNVTNLQQLSTPAETQGAPLQNSLAQKKDLPALAVEPASGQDATLAGVSGHITDRSGAIVAGAMVTLRDAAGKTRQTSTGPDGSFHLTELPAGQYELTTTATGFKTSKQSIELKPSELAMLQPVLDVGATSGAVTVGAESVAQTVQTESADVAGEVVAETPSVSPVIPVPSSLPVRATVSHGKRLLSLDNAGNLFLSRNGGKKWEKINSQWAGKAVRIELTPTLSTGAVFQLTTDAHAVWTSKDGAHWHQP